MPRYHDHPASMPGPGDLAREPEEPLHATEEIAELREEGQWSPCWVCPHLGRPCSRDPRRVHACAEA